MRWSVLAMLVAPLPLLAQGDRRYEIVEGSVRATDAYQRDRKVLIDVRFQLRGLSKGTTESQDMVVVTEGGKEVHRIPLDRVRDRDLTTAFTMDLAADSSDKKVRDAHDGADLFFEHLHPRADSGLLLFDRRLQNEGIRYPADSPKAIPSHRRELVSLIRRSRPDGSSAYLDAAHSGLSMMSKYKGDRAVILLTDGINKNSQKKFTEVVEFATRERIPVYVLGVGDPSWTLQVSTVLVLDHSASMSGKAGNDARTKMEALYDSASHFVDLMRPGATVALLPFSSQVDEVQDFTSDRDSLKARIRDLRPRGGTAFYDAVYAGVEAVVATRPKGNLHVVALTDGVDEDPGSRHSPEQVIQLAREEGVKLYLLGLGRREEINEEVMTRMARETGGRYEHAGNQDELFRKFEMLSKDIHRDGIDEEALRELATRTRGKYYHVKDASQLKLAYESLARDLQETYTITFPSRNQSMDALPSAIDVFIVDGSGKVISNVGKADSHRTGLVPALFNYVAYLVLLFLLLGLLKVPSLLKRMAPSR